MDVCKINVEDISSMEAGTQKTVVDTFKFSGNCFLKTLGKMLLRIPVLSIAIGAALELTELNKSLKTKGNALEKAESFGKQLIKSSNNVLTSTVLISLCGALLAPYGFTASIIGIGLGGIASAFAIKNINKKVDNLF